VTGGTVLWALVALGLLVVVTRRRSIAVGLVTAQALILVGIALDRATRVTNLVAAGALLVRAAALAALFLWLTLRTRNPRPIRAAARPFVRAGVALALALTLTWLVPSFGLLDRNAERAVLALVAFGLVSVAMRRPTLFQVIGIVLVENGLALAALELPGAPSLLVELGVALDLTLIALVAAVFHFRIFIEFGTADTAALRSLRD
jgi:hydrogenase-4 membrane subunit HyfE